MYRSPRDPLKDELWAQGLSWSVIEMPDDTPLENTDFSFPRRFQSQTSNY